MARKTVSIDDDDVVIEKTEDGYVAHQTAQSQVYQTLRDAGFLGVYEDGDDSVFGKSRNDVTMRHDDFPDGWGIVFAELEDNILWMRVGKLS